MSKPSFQWYPDDWLNDLGLRSCSPLARAVWMDMLCLMHQGVPYGYLTNATGPLPQRFLANKCGITIKQLTGAVEELETHKVFSRESHNGAIFSRRMVRDEYRRNARAAGGAESLKNPNVPKKRSPLPPPEGILPSNGKVSFDPEEEELKKKQKKEIKALSANPNFDAFEEFWGKWPRQMGRDSALSAWLSYVAPGDENKVLECEQRFLKSKDCRNGAVPYAGPSTGGIDGPKRGWLGDCAAQNWNCGWPTEQQYERKLSPLEQLKLEKKRQQNA